MATRVVLHVGTMKSGTSYLQSLLHGQQRALADQGVLVPGETWVDVARAVRQAVSRPPGAGSPRWQALCREVAGHRGEAVISMEYLGAVPLVRARRIVRQLGADEVRVVVTARDLNRNLVSMWQETVQNGRAWTWEDYVAGVREHAPGGTEGTIDTTTPGGTFWRQQGLLRMTRTWGEAVGADGVVVVTLPPPGAPRSLLAERFAEAADLPIDLDAPVSTANESLGLPSVLLLRRVNELLDAEGLTFPAAGQWRKKVLAKTVLAARRREEEPLGLDVAAWVEEQTRATVRALAGTRVVGDWSDLDPVAVPGITPGDVDPAVVAEAAAVGLAGLLAELARG